MFELHSFIVFLVIFETYSYPLQCPDISQRQLRETGYCTNSLQSEYSCLYDTYWLWFSEQCNKIPDYVTPGEKYVISGGLRNVECSSTRYQPFPLWSNVSGECMYQKSQCIEKGQVLFNNGSHISDGTCRCDYTNGYKFIRQPKLSDSCTPTEEDCSCYISKCPDGLVLSSDYECVDAKQYYDSKQTIVENESGSLKNENIKRNTEIWERKPSSSLYAMIAVLPMVLAYAAFTCLFVFWNIEFEDHKECIHELEKTLKKYEKKVEKLRERIAQQQGKYHNVKGLGKDEPTIDETAWLKLKDTYLEKRKVCLEDISRLKDDNIAALKQLMEQKKTELENNDTEIVTKNKERTERDNMIKEIDREIIKRENDKKVKTAGIRVIETERKKLHNQIVELKGNIRVFCRVRPLLNHEKKGNNCKKNHISFPGQNKIKVVKTSNALLNEIREPTTFSFDKVFKHNATQEQVFGEISQLIQSALDGFNVCIFAYGQTGSGKTYTMEGTSVGDDTNVNRGMIPRSVLQIFDTIRKLKIQGWTYTVDASCLEIYEKEIKDLLCNTKVDQKIEIQDVNNETRVTNITIKRVATENEVYMLLQKASKNRTVAETKSNQRSSRGHSVFTLKMTAENSITNETSKSTLYLVDLAASERTKTSGVEGQHMKEAVAINESLPTLGRVIRAVKNKQTVIPFRDSNLTYLLQHSMGGNSKTLMLVNISPQEDCVEETLNSLKFAKEANQCKIGVAQKNQ